MLDVTSIFQSIDGEVNHFHQGRMSTFIRLSTCNLQCTYCDTRHAWNPNTLMSVESVIAAVQQMEVPKVTITGGEPLLQTNQGLQQLIERLSWMRYNVTIETNGSLFIPPSLLGIRSVKFVMDYKLASSGMTYAMNLAIFEPLGIDDFVKFVICDEADFLEAVNIKNQLQQTGCCATFAFSPIHGKFDPAKLVGLMRTHKQHDAVLNLQLHKLIWPCVPAGEER